MQPPRIIPPPAQPLLQCQQPQRPCPPPTIPVMSKKVELIPAQETKTAGAAQAALSPAIMPVNSSLAGQIHTPYPGYWFTTAQTLPILAPALQFRNPDWVTSAPAETVSPHIWPPLAQSNDLRDSSHPGFEYYNKADDTLFKRVIVQKNGGEHPIGSHVTEEQILQVPEQNIADGQNTIFYDPRGNFICSIIYDAVNIDESTLNQIALLARATSYRGPASGPINQEDWKAKQKKGGKAISFPADKPWEVIVEGKKKDHRGNRQCTTVYGCSRLNPLPSKVAESKAEGFELLEPYFALISQLFKQYWNNIYTSYYNNMMRSGGSDFYVPGSVFSSMVINTHEIDAGGTTKKDSRAAIHTDNGHHTYSYELMPCFKRNIKGGDLFLPEYGILLKLNSKCLVCFQAGIHKHAVTPIDRIDPAASALRVTMVAYMWRFGERSNEKVQCQKNPTIHQAARKRKKDEELIAEKPKRQRVDGERAVIPK